MQQRVTSFVVLSILTFVCACCQPLVNSRVQNKYSALKNGKFMRAPINVDGICDSCVNSTCHLPSGYCFINGMCLRDGDRFYTCLQCDSSQNQFEWSYNPVCSTGNARCSNKEFLAQHVCDSSIINAFYTNFQNATVAFFNSEICSNSSCQPGFFFSMPGSNSDNRTQTTIFSCCPGYFCPNGQTCMIPCREAAYCPSPLTPKNGFCLTDAQCPQNPPVQFTEYGCGGSSVEGFCPSDFYCPDPSTKVSCENLDTAYCPAGAIKPIDCPTGFTCQKGILRNSRIWTTAMAVVFTLFGLLILLYAIINLGILRWIAKKYEYYWCFPSIIYYQRERSYREEQETSDYFKSLHTQSESSNIGFNIELENAKLNIPKWTESNKGFTFTMKAGQINAIMGQSGCGKTSLLYAIQGRKGLRKDGKIVFNDKSMKNSHWHPLTTRLSDWVGYVPQEDVMHLNLTVFETVYYSARTRRLKDDIETIKNDVIFVLEKLDMTQKWHTLTEKLSGGEKKRVNIAMEIAACPKILLLDEPTSGLDTVVCDRVFDLLNRIKQNQLCSVNIIVIIHQPSYELFQRIDHLTLLTPGCHLAYSGPREGAINHLRAAITTDQNSVQYQQVYESKNECDCCTYALTHYPNESAINGQSANRLEDEKFSLFNLKPTNRQSVLMPMVYLIHRTGVQMFRRNYTIEAVYGLAFFLLGLIIGRLYRKRIDSCDITALPSLYFMISLGFGIATCIASQRLFGVEMVDKTFIRETRNYYHPIQYWLAKSLVDLVHMLLYPLLFLSMLYVEIKPRSSFGDYYSVLLATSFACSAVGQFVSVACHKTENSYLAATLIALVSCLISGFNPTKQEELHNLVYFSFSRHVQRQLFIYDSRKYAQNAMTGSLWDTQIGRFRLHYSFGDNERSVACLVGIGIIFRFLTIIFLYGRSEYRSKLRFYFSKLFDMMGYQPR